MKNFLGLLLLLPLAGQPYSSASEATNSKILSSIAHQSINASDLMLPILILKIYKHYVKNTP